MTISHTYHLDEFNLKARPKYTFIFILFFDEIDEIKQIRRRWDAASRLGQFWLNLSLNKDARFIWVIFDN